MLIPRFKPTTDTKICQKSCWATLFWIIFSFLFIFMCAWKSSVQMHYVYFVSNFIYARGFDVYYGIIKINPTLKNKKIKYKIRMRDFRNQENISLLFNIYNFRWCTWLVIFNLILLLNCNLINNDIYLTISR